MFLRMGETVSGEDDRWIERFKQVRGSSEHHPKSESDRVRPRYMSKSNPSKVLRGVPRDELLIDMLDQPYAGVHATPAIVARECVFISPSAKRELALSRHHLSFSPISREEEREREREREMGFRIL